MPAVLVTNDSARDFDDDSEESLRVAVDHRRRGDRDSPADADYDSESDRPTSRRGRTGPAEQDGYQDDDWSDTEREDPGEQYSFVCAFQVKACTLQY